MISRVAESCFWLSRYLERTDALARLLYVSQTTVLDTHLAAEDRWKPLMIVIGEEEQFEALQAKAEGNLPEVVEEFLTWDRNNPSSIWHNLYWLRENARTIRETISLEMWETINEAWLWMNSRSARNLYNRERFRFHARLREACALFHGHTFGTMLHEEAFDFMRLGSMLERASQTARTLDVKYHALGRTRGGKESALEAAQWLAILYACSGVEPFFKRSENSLSGPAVARFLMFDQQFPRSILHCLVHGQSCLEQICRYSRGPYGQDSRQHLTELLESVRGQAGDETVIQRLHSVLTWIVDETTAVCGTIQRDFFEVPRQSQRAAS